MSQFRSSTTQAREQQQQVQVQEKPQSDERERGLLGWMILTSLFVMWTFFTLVFLALAPAIVCQGESCYGEKNDGCEKRPPDYGKCVIAGLVTTFVVGIILWLFFLAMK